VNGQPVPRELDELLARLEQRVDLLDLIAIAHWSSEVHTDDERLRERCQAEFQSCLNRFRNVSDGVRQLVSTAGHIRSGVAYHEGAEELDFKLGGEHISLAWTQFTSVCTELDKLADAVKAWVDPGDERRVLLGRVYSQAAGVLAVHNKEAVRRHREGVAPGDAGSDDFVRTMRDIRGQVDELARDIDLAIARSTQRKYAVGMGVGIAIALVTSGLLWCLSKVGAGVPEFYVIAGAMGAIGAVVSVFQRMSRSGFRIDVHAAGRMVWAFGASRAAIGSVFGVVALAVVRSGLASIAGVDPEAWTDGADYGSAAAWSVIIGFTAGFNERFAQDLLAGLARTDDDRSAARRDGGSS
jgi:hypothetical protein